MAIIAVLDGQHRPLRLPGSLTHHLSVVAGQIAQLSNRLGWNKTRSHKTVLDQPRDPLGILDVFYELKMIFDGTVNFAVQLLRKKEAPMTDVLNDEMRRWPSWTWMRRSRRRVWRSSSRQSARRQTIRTR